MIYEENYDIVKEKPGKKGENKQKFLWLAFFLSFAYQGWRYHSHPRQLRHQEVGYHR